MTNTQSIDTVKKLYDEAARLDVTIFWRKLYKYEAISSKDGCVVLDSTLFGNRERAILAHELGHFISGAFYPIYCTIDDIARAECRADRAAIKTFIPYTELLTCLQKYMTPWEIANHFGLTVEAIQKAYYYYKDVMQLEFK